MSVFELTSKSIQDLPPIDSEAKRYVDKLKEEELDPSLQSAVWIAYHPANVLSRSKFSRESDDLSKSLSSSVKWKEHLFILSTLRLYICHKGVFGMKTRTSYPLIYLRDIQVEGDIHNDQFILCLGFAQWSGELEESPEPVEYLQILLTHQQSKDFFLFLYAKSALLHNSAPDHVLPQLNVPRRFVKRFESCAPTSGPNNSEAILQRYIALCDLQGVLPQTGIFLYLQNALVEGERTLDLPECFGFVEADIQRRKRPKLSTEDAISLFGAIQYNAFFHKIIAYDCFIGDELLSPIQLPLSQNREVFIVRLVRCGMTKIAAKAFARGLASIQSSPLREIVISDNSIGNDGVQAIAEAIIKSKPCLDGLVLSVCGFSSKGVKAIAEALEEHILINEGGLRVLNLSGNALGSHSGSKALVPFLSASKALKRLYLANCGVDVGTVFNAMKQNESCKVSLVDLSANRITKTSSPQMIEFIEKSKYLSNLFLAMTRPSYETVLQLFSALFVREDLTFNIDISRNNLSGILFSALQEALDCCRGPVLNIHSLDISANGFSGSQVARICDLLHRFHGLCSLDLSSNVKVRLLRDKSREAGKAIAGLLSRLQLKELIVNGDANHQLADGVLPILESLQLDKNLIKLEIRANRMSYKHFESVARALRTNQTLRVLDIDDNRASLRSLRLFLPSASNSKSLLSLHILSDVEKAAGSKAIRKELAGLVEELDQSLHRNRFIGTRDLYAEIVEGQSNLIENVREEFEREAKMIAARRKNTSIVVDGDQEDQPSFLPDWSSPQFGIPIDQCECEMLPGYVSGIPKVLVFMSRWLRMHKALDSVGVFRLAPDKNDAAVVKDELNDGTFEDTLDLHNVANNLKVWFRDLPVKLLSSVPTETFIEMESGGSAEKIIEMLPEPNISLLYWLLDLCVTFSMHSEKNKMNPQNLAIVFSPNLTNFEDLEPMKGLSAQRGLSSFLEAAINWRKHNGYTAPVSFEQTLSDITASDLRIRTLSSPLSHEDEEEE